ncbi:YjbH domain-containing protein [Aerophototrophica crusticola]|uniref:YjbH domain-containing protein n=1 Tax=Aerophototrophica crusticola TaxID=1709002 RepID=A0A858R4X1_9PROT|nr:YjbH domain-containing protein [Rhodospirillaceae bacterium B3]
MGLSLDGGPGSGPAPPAGNPALPRGPGGPGRYRPAAAPAGTPAGPGRPGCLCGKGRRAGAGEPRRLCEAGRRADGPAGRGLPGGDVRRCRRELEYRPFRSTWRLGLRVHQAWKREPGFGLRQDTGVTTGAVGIRQDIGDPDTVLSLAGERFLDGGWGPVAALEMRLPGGGLLEAEALLADGLAVGLGLRVPLGRFLGPVEATMAAKTKPLARDTGQRLERPLRLADLTDRIGYGRLAAGWEGLLGDPVTCAARWCRSPGPGRR